MEVIDFQPFIQQDYLNMMRLIIYQRIKKSVDLFFVSMKGENVKRITIILLIIALTIDLNRTLIEVLY